MKKYIIDGVNYDPITMGDVGDFDEGCSPDDTCHDCGCHFGEQHSDGCDAERCPACGGQLISCGCNVKVYEIDNKLKKQLLEKIEHELKNINYDEFLDVRKLQSEKIIERLKKCDFTDKEFGYLLKQKDLIKTIYNKDIQWHVMMDKYSDYASADIGAFISSCEMEERLANIKSKKKQADEEM